MASDEVLRQGVQSNLQNWIQRLECEGDIEKQHSFKRKFIKKLKHSPVAINTDKANEQHYEVPTEFFRLVLGKRLKYSSCLWSEAVQTLDEAEEEMFKLTCERAQVQDGHSILDLGCGWGSLSMYICEKFPHCSVVCVSNSNTQRQLIEEMAFQRGYSRKLQCITEDANFFTTEQKFDRVISLEMFEHMKNYEQLMARVATWLKPSGLLFTQILCHRAFPYAFDTKKGSDTEWMARNFFSGGTMPSSDLFLYFQNDLALIDHWQVNGKHYTKTLDAWLAKLDQRKQDVLNIFERAYGKKEAKKQVFNWRLFFIFCSEVFGYKDGNEWIVSHHLFKKRVLSSL